MKKRIFLYTILILFAGLISFFGLSVYIAYNNNYKLAKDSVMETARICAGLYRDDIEASSFVKVGGDTRITVIAPDGRVLADSRPVNINAIENHLDRPEIQAALNGSPAASVRYSDTLGVDLIYYALKVDSGDSFVFIRTAIPVAKIDAYLSQSLPLLVFFLLIVAILCFLLVRLMVNRILLPFGSLEQKLRLLSEGEYTPEPVAGSYEEIDSITREINEVAQILQTSFTALRDEKNKMEYILNNIGEGLFVVDENRLLVLINSSATDIFNVKPAVNGKNLNHLTRDKTIIAAVDDCLSQEKSALFEHALNGRIFYVVVSRLPDTQLTMVALSDVTESRENAKRREEFFANASHELKTPLTAIKGFNELTAINNKDEKLQKYIDSIARETDRMLTLIGNMLKLSELENMQEINPVPVSLAKTVEEVREVLSAVIDERAIVFEAVGDAMISAEPGHIYELVKNLLENAVRYNNQGGRVSVTIDGDKDSKWLFVYDSGIGISPEEQARIFERFYRVERSRSQRNGGTGLGLAIVKHICALYDWKLSLKSRLGIGTEITVIFGNK